MSKVPEPARTKTFKGNKGLLCKDRFHILEKEKKRWLANLSWKKAIELEERLISSELIWEWRKNFPKDNPICLKMSPRKKQRT